MFAFVTPPKGSPLFFASDAHRRSWIERIPPGRQDMIKSSIAHARTARVTASQFGAHEVLILAAEPHPSGFVATPEGGIIVRVLEGDPAAVIPADVAKGVKTWKDVGVEYESRGDAQSLFATARESVPAALADGGYEVRVGLKKKPGSRLELIRFERKRKRRPRKNDTEVVTALSPADVDAAVALTWISGSGIAFVAREAHKAWSGVDIDAPDDPEIQTQKEMEGLVIPGEPQLMWSTPDGLLLITGEEGFADDCVAAALSIPEGRWQPTKLSVSTGESGEMTLLDTAKKGKSTTVALARGRYGVARVNEWTTPAAKLGLVLKLSRSTR